VVRGRILRFLQRTERGPNGLPPQRPSSLALTLLRVPVIEGVHIAPNWTSSAGALEGILEFLGAPLPRHAIMGLTGHAWHTCLGSREGVVALPSGPLDLDWGAMTANYARTGFAWERFPGIGTLAADRLPAIAWAMARLDLGRPVIGFDFHLHEYSVVYGYDLDGHFLVDNVLSEEVGPVALWRDWPSAVGRIELFAPVGPVEVDPARAVSEALRTAVACLEGRDGPADGQPRGTAALSAWADAFEGDTVVDRAGNAYTLAVIQAARLDGAAFIGDLADSLPDLAVPLAEAERALRDETQALAPLITLFPFPSGGHGNVANPGLRRAAAMALRRAADHERAVAAALAEALAKFGEFD
jgi:hypothetical protein